MYKHFYLFNTPINVWIKPLNPDREFTIQEYTKYTYYYLCVPKWFAIAIYRFTKPT